MCNLETVGGVAHKLRSLAWGKALVSRISDVEHQGVCSIGDIDFSRGNKSLASLKGQREFYIGCGEYDQNGGDCEIRGRVVCR